MRRYTNMQQEYKCAYCDKKYKRKKPYDKHLELCQSLNTVTSDEFLVVPNAKVMYKLIKHIIKENNQLKIRVNKLEQKLNRKKKPIQVLEWLNNNDDTVLYKQYKPYESFIENNKNIKNIIDEFLATICKHDYYFKECHDDLYVLIIKHIIEISNIMISFKGKNKIFIYKNKVDKWEQLDLDTFKILLCKIQRYIIIDFSDYCNIRKISEEQYAEISDKILSGTVQKNTLQTIYNKTSKILEIDIKKELDIKIIL